MPIIRLTGRAKLAPHTVYISGVSKSTKCILVASWNQLHVFRFVSSLTGAHFSTMAAAGQTVSGALVVCFLVLAVSCQSNTATNVIQPCSYTAPSGDEYDMSPLVVNLTSSTTKWQMYTGTDVNANNYWMNVCNVVTSDTGCATADQTPVCQTSSSGLQATPCGDVTSQVFQPASRCLHHPPHSSMGSGLCCLFSSSPLG